MRAAGAALARLFCVGVSVNAKALINPLRLFVQGCGGVTFACD